MIRGPQWKVGAGDLKVQMRGVWHFEGRRKCHGGHQPHYLACDDDVHRRKVWEWTEGNGNPQRERDQIFWFAWKVPIYSVSEYF